MSTEVSRNLKNSLDQASSTSYLEN